METITLVDLAPILAAVVGPMLVFAAATMRYQHLDSIKTRDLIDRNHRELSSSLGDARERLSRMEGYLQGAPPPTREIVDGDAEAA